ncbi:hypothetical protein ES705_46118 [subsurface metagenome]
MNDVKRNRIHNLAYQLREALNIETSVTLKDVVENRLGGIIEYVSDLRTNGNEIEAKIEKHKKSFKITINENMIKTRNNFAIAHELGHLFIHMGYLINDKLWNSVDEYSDSVYFRFGYSEEELEANEFAAAFQMPEDEYNNILRQNINKDTINFDKIAHHFGVSIEAAVTRGKWLGIIAWD